MPTSNVHIDTANAEEYGGISCLDGATPQTINIARAKLLNWTTDELSSSGVVPDHANSKVTVKSAGTYDVAFTMNGSFPAARILYLHVSVNGTEALMAGVKRGGSGGAVPTIGGSSHGLLALNANDVVEIYASTDVDGQTFTMLEASLQLAQTEHVLPNGGGGGGLTVVQRAQLAGLLSVLDPNGRADDRSLNATPPAGQDALATVVANRTTSAAVLARAAAYGAPLPTWDPSYDSDTVGWYFADDATVVSGAVSVIPNRVLAGINPLVQATAGSRPAYEATGWLGSYPSFLLDGVDDYLTANGLAGYVSGSDLPWAVAMSMQPVTVYDKDFFSFGKSTIDAQYMKIYGDAGANLDTFRHDDAAASAFNQGAITDARHILIVSFSGTALSAWVDGVITINAGACNVAAFTVDQFTLGALGRTTYQNFSNYRCREFVMIKRALTAAQVARLNASLESRSPTY